MNHYENRQVGYLLAWLLGILIGIYLLAILLFYAAGGERRNHQAEVARLAINRTAITKVTDYYQLDRGVNAYSVKGLTAKRQRYYFIYLPASQRAYVYPQSQGTSETTIRRHFNRTHTAATISQVNLGWYKDQAVWEVAYQTLQGRLGYTLYTFKGGNRLSDIANLS
mgnify:CR=1 FL=1